MGGKVHISRHGSSWGYSGRYGFNYSSNLPSNHPDVANTAGSWGELHTSKQSLFLQYSSHESDNRFMYHYYTYSGQYPGTKRTLPGYQSRPSIDLAQTRRLLPFHLGVFVMTAAIIRVILIFHPTGQFGPGAMWSIREDFVAIFVGQAPMIVPMFKKRFWQQPRSRFTPKSSQGSEGHELGHGMSNQNQNKKPKDPYSLTQMGFTHITNITNVTRNTQAEKSVVGKGSQEEITVTEENIGTEGAKSQSEHVGVGLGVNGHVEYDERSHSLDITRAPDLESWRPEVLTTAKGTPGV
ncbi:uncharacterized protein CTRU02_200243 [Colletotrichum truncatum]|uniref:Uncharacterized protein n=1 Tax=Colletotrichum truncatum TaxID=5467 RepID=A0ACC3ZE15_COLTU